MSSAGWYPDPGGQPGMYRYWNGTAWTTAITPNPAGTQPPSTAPAAQPSKRSNLGWWLGGLAALVAVVVGVWFVAQNFLPSGVLGGGSPASPGSNPTQLVCPRSNNTTAEPTTGNKDGWITSGKLAFPALGDPWTTGLDTKVPYGSVATVQTVLDQDNFDGQGSSWVASVLVSDLYVGDGFASTKQGAEIVLKCVLGIYYSDTVVTQQLISSAAHDVDGHDGWLIETNLSFSIPNLNATSERVLLLVVQTGDNEYGLFYSSVPNTLEHLMPDARKALSGLQVRG